MRVQRALVVGFVALATLAACLKQPAPTPTNQSAHPGHSAPPAAGHRTALLGNLGAYQRPIKTTNADAQKFFDEGLTLLYGFNHEESFKSFERAAALDPASPMVVVAPIASSQLVEAHGPRQMDGVACLRGFRIPVATIVALVAERQSVDDILKLYPDLEAGDVRKALLLAAEAV